MAGVGAPLLGVGEDDPGPGPGGHAAQVAAPAAAAVAAAAGRAAGPLVGAAVGPRVPDLDAVPGADQLRHAAGRVGNTGR